MKIVLIGFMGSGKTSVAKALAKKLGLNFIDMDELILKSTGFESINKIFAEKGEQFFRKAELLAAKKLANIDDVVISTGGGVVMDKQTMIPLLKISQIVYLKISFDNAKKRVSLKKIRPPLFKDIFFAKKLFDKREPLYRSYANIIIDTDNMELSEVVETIIKLGKGKNGRK